MQNIIEAKNLVFEYYNYDDDGQVKDSVTALNHISVDVKEGEFLVILGHNGSGKSTFAKHLNSILTPKEGTLIVSGIDATDKKNTWDIRKQVGMVFQNPDNQIVATIIEEDVAFGPENLGIEPSEIRKRVDDALETVGMSDYKKGSPNQLSGGQKQRIAIAGVIAMKPKCIVFDESTAMLDPIGRRQVMSTMQKLNKEYGITIIHITHYMQEAILADRIIVMDKGKVVLEGTPKEVFKEVKRIKDIGLDVPDTTYLVYLLNQEGFDLPIDLLTVEEVTDAICQLR
ncbi:energy-coupling factor transporter ATPase [Cellulosilyticum lentocellum]|uniref:Polyamine-transporting ATPase n=1 Tax=Cellulosilyticum lentocellum (strain ATCC 49066 / DSM 5427 / NCIMB 11756 / RHM5) TaxID=642492 RepID=F2JSG1_CELLD|nr:energy-coupling factor transporter ATPase [Cellulosilyticum lentocellum]ADZ85199.1 Polyamine-transporting ATPase [Cellulosilyticum lentocellum DSM 5427]